MSKTAQKSAPDSANAVVREKQQPSLVTQQQGQNLFPAVTPFPKHRAGQDLVIKIHRNNVSTLELMIEIARYDMAMFNAMYGLAWPNKKDVEMLLSLSTIQITTLAATINPINFYRPEDIRRSMQEGDPLMAAVALLNRS